MKTDSDRSGPTATRLMGFAAAGLAAALAAIAAFAWAALTPAEVLVYARTDHHGALVAAGARARARFWDGCPREAFLPATPLGALTAAWDGSSGEQERALLALARVMIEKGCGVNDYGRSGTTPLMDAVIFGNPRSARMLLELGADRSPRKQPAAGRGPSPLDGKTAVEMAAFLQDRPAGAHGDRKAVLDLLGR